MSFITKAEAQPDPPQTIESCVDEYFTHCEKDGNACSEQLLVDMGIPKHIQHMLRLEILSELVHNSGVFAGCSDAFVRLELV